MRVWRVGCVLVGLAALWCSAPASASAAFSAGAATVDTAPPLFNAATDAADPYFTTAPPQGNGNPVANAACSRAAFNGPRHWRFEEPYVDTNSDGEFDYQGSGGPGTAPVPEPFCDINGNGRWDGIYTSGQIAQQPDQLDPNSPLDARAVAISDGIHTNVIVSVAVQGLFLNYIDQMRAEAQALTGNRITEMVVSANHNESSPDTVGIYGAPEDPSGAFGVNSGIDEYYMNYLVDRVAGAAKQAVDNLQPASLRTTSFYMPANVCVNLSKQIPTTNDDGSPAAIDPKFRILQASTGSGGGGTPIFTMMNLAAHNQEIGHGPLGPSTLSGDWPGYFSGRLEQDVGGGVGVFMVADNGSEEDPSTVADPSDGDGCKEPNGSLAQAQTTGQALADDVNSRLGGATDLTPGGVGGRHTTFCVPIENNLFKAAFAARLFGEHQGYTPDPTCQAAGPFGTDTKTRVSELQVGPDLQFIDNPGEAFPALMIGNPWGVDEVGCPNRPNPPAPVWHASAPNRFQIGLADDMIGYEIPAWAYSEMAGVFTNEPPNLDSCVNDPSTGRDPAGHRHKLESEGVGPSGSNRVATELTGLLDPSPGARPDLDIRPGRYVSAGGSLSRRVGPSTVGVWLAAPGTNPPVLAPGTGTLIALPGIRSFGSVPVDANGSFMDYDGAALAAPSAANCPTDVVNAPRSVCLVARGMRTGSGARKRSPSVAHYVAVYDAVDVRGGLGAASARPPHGG